MFLICAYDRIGPKYEGPFPGIHSPHQGEELPCWLGDGGLGEQGRRASEDTPTFQLAFVLQPPDFAALFVLPTLRAPFYVSILKDCVQEEDFETCL